MGYVRLVVKHIVLVSFGYIRFLVSTVIFIHLFKCICEFKNVNDACKVIICAMSRVTVNHINSAPFVSQNLWTAENDFNLTATNHVHTRTCNENRKWIWITFHRFHFIRGIIHDHIISLVTAFNFGSFVPVVFNRISFEIDTQSFLNDISYRMIFQ